MTRITEKGQKVPKLKLTKQAVKNLPIPPQGKTERYFDTETEGLFIRALPSGRRTYAIRYKEKGTGDKKEKVLGPAKNLSPSEAREMAKRHYAGMLLNGAKTEDPNILMNELVKEYYHHCRVKHQRESTLEQKRVLSEKYVLPKFGNDPVVSVKARHIQSYLRDIAERNKMPPTSRAVRTYLIGLFKYAVSCEYVEDNPALKTEVYGENIIRDRSLSDEEIVCLIDTLNCGTNENHEVRDATLLLLLTGARSSEVSNMQWQELDFEKRIWTIPASRNKSKREFKIYLSDEMLEVLGGRQKKVSGLVFELSKKSITQRLKRISSVNCVTKNQFQGKFTAHDIRRTFATGLAKNLKVPEITIERLLNHASSNGGSIKHYNTYDYEEEKKLALIKWGKYVSELYGNDALIGS